MTRTTVAGVLLLALTGCASITGEKMQIISVQTIQDNKEIAGADCTLSNEEGKWSVTTPGNVVVHKSTTDLLVWCNKDNTGNGQEKVVSKANGGAWGNILLGGPIGYIADRQTGAGFNYPVVITVMLKKIGEAVGLIDPPKAQATVQAAAPVAATQPATVAASTATAAQ